jgi:hypothetical protein
LHALTQTYKRIQSIVDPRGIGVQRTDAAFNELRQAALAAGFGVASDWFELHGGRTNRVFWGQFTTGKLVFKFFDKDRANTLFPNDVDAEKNALLTLAGTGLAPTLRGRMETKEGPCIVYDYVNGTAVEQTTAVTMSALARLHGLPPPQGFRHISSDPVSVLEHGVAFLTDDNSSRAKALRANMPEVPVVGTPPMRFLHGDPTPANSVNTAKGVTFIDWQCPAIGDPVHDLSIALSPAMHVANGLAALTLAQTESLIKSYSDTCVAARYRALERLYRWRMACFCQWKTQCGEMVYEAAGRAEFS